MTVERALLKHFTNAQLLELVFQLDHELGEMCGEREALLVAVKTAYGYAKRRNWSRCGDTLGTALVDVAILGTDSSNHSGG